MTMKLTRRTFLISSVAAAAYVVLPSLQAATWTIDVGGGRSITGTLPAGRYAVTAEIEFAAAPIADDLVEFYWGPTGAAAINSQFIGTMMSLSERFIIGYVGVFQPGCEKGQLIVVNRASQPMEAKVEMIELKPVLGNEDNSIKLQAGKTITFDSEQSKG